MRENEVVVVELKAKLEDIIPWGYICEDYLHQFSNGNFEMKNSYRLRKNKKLTFNKIDYYVASHEMANNLLRDFAVNQEIFITTGVLTQNHLPQDVSPPTSKIIPIARFNQTFASKNYLQKLRELSTG